MSKFAHVYTLFQRNPDFKLVSQLNGGCLISFSFNKHKRGFLVKTFFWNTDSIGFINTVFYIQ